LIKSINRPETESPTIYLFSGTNALITLLTIKTWNFASWGFPGYFLIICSTLFLLIKYKLGKNIVKSFKK